MSKATIHHGGDVLTIERFERIKPGTAGPWLEYETTGQTRWTLNGEEIAEEQGEALFGVWREELSA